MRLFLGFELPDEVRAELGRVQAKLRASSSGWRWAAPEGIHLTLRFLGEVRPEQDQEHRVVWRAVVRPFGPVRFRLSGTGVFPGPRSPRVLWIGIDEEPPGGRLPALAAALEAAARAEGFAPETRPLHPHLTLARSARDERPSVPREVVADLGRAVECSEVVLFRSELSRAGARYARLEAFPLAGTGGQTP